MRNVRKILYHKKIMGNLLKKWYNICTNWFVEGFESKLLQKYVKKRHINSRRETTFHCS